jgi:hypothetical protein
VCIVIYESFLAYFSSAGRNKVGNVRNVIRTCVRVFASWIRLGWPYNLIRCVALFSTVGMCRSVCDMHEMGKIIQVLID